MKRLAAAVALALALAGSAAADTFRVLPATGGDVFTVLPGTAPSMSGPLPSADSPNAPGSIAFPDSVRSYPLVPETRTYAQLLDLWQQSGAAYGVSWEVLAAINKIESNFGRNMGPSSAGAIGWMQFMPSTWERWGLDGDGDGIANPWSPEDAIPAAARYLAASGGQADISRAIFSYNHAQWYVDEVQQLAQLFNAGGVDATFNLDKLQISLDNARAVVVQTNRKLVKALRSSTRARPPRTGAPAPGRRDAPALRSFRPRSPRGSGRRRSSRRPGARGRPPRDARAGRDGPRVRA